ncbi:DUF3263 domain-containing protein (plasmid) [Rhodococcus sp. USK10]|uniref:DUF3263 domain-containing protein n=1 Tax=Rhodococcus sp. USK10 TaxID=2789739 RepID=UPI001C6019CD|nr:DUF3263 domain-containing protein [Rhodococcus sp. USK10]QYA99836.1 DUF3263 domain-containing protein [Rhodococcus sp. USK10]
MTRDTHAMLAFATKWSRFGGGDEYILPEFGITPTVFYQRILAMVTSTLINEVDFATRTHLREFCSHKIVQAKATPPVQVSR